MKPNSQNARLLAVLQRGPATNREIHERAGHMVVNSRVSELVHKYGYEIRCEHLGGSGAGAYRYTLVAESNGSPLPEGEPTGGAPDGVEAFEGSVSQTAASTAEFASPSGNGEPKFGADVLGADGSTASAPIHLLPGWTAVSPLMAVQPTLWDAA